MNTRNLYFSLLFMVVAFLSSCSDENGLVDPVETTGTVSLTINCGKVGSVGQRAINLEKLTITLEALGEQSVYDTIVLSGNGTSIVSKDYSALASEKEWTITCNTIDQNGVIIHSGSKTATIIPVQTVKVDIALNASYSMLVASFFPIADSCNKCILKIDNSIIRDSLFTPAEVAVGDTVTLEYDYLSASSEGVLHDFMMQVRGPMWGVDTLLYEGDTSFSVVSGIDSDVELILYWVGPDTAPDGAATITVNLGSIGKTTIKGEIKKD